MFELVMKPVLFSRGEVSSMPLTTILFLTLYFIGCVGALRLPILGVVTYLAVYLIYPETAWWSKPIEWMGIRYSYTAGLFTLIGLLLNHRRLGTPGSFWHRQEVLFALLVASMWVSLHTGVGPCDMSYRTLDKMVKVLVFLVMMTHIATDLRSFRYVLWTLVMGTFYLAHQSYVAGPASFMDGRLNAIGGPDFDRAPELGVHFVAILPLIGALLLRERRWYVRVFLVLCAALTFNGIVLTRTRSAMTAILAGIAFAFLKLPKRWRVKAIGIGTVGLIGAYALTDQGFWERMATIPTAYQEQTEAEVNEQGFVMAGGRITAWRAAWHMWMENPLGVGIGNFTRLIEFYPPAYFAIDAHNSLVLCFAELGIFGITLFTALLWGTWGQLGRIRRAVRSERRLWLLELDVFALQTSFFMFFVGGLTVSRFYCEMFWCLLAIPICFERAVLRELRQPCAVKTPEAARTASSEVGLRSPHPTPALAVGT